MQYCILECIDKNVSAYYNESIKINHILATTKEEEIIWTIAMAVLKFIGGVLPLVQELLKAFM